MQELISKENNIEINKTELNQITIEEQKKFLDTNLGKAINTGINIGLKLILPDLIENQIIQIKDILMEQGLKEGINEILNSVTDFGKSVTGIFTGKFENISQIETAIKSGGVIDITSTALNSAIDLAKKNKLINSSTASLLKKGKNAILNNISGSIEDMITSQIKSIENIDKYSNNWRKAYEEKNIDKMKKEYKKIEKELEKIIPLENTIKNAREIENIHKLIENNGNNFNLSTDEVEIAKKLL